MTNFVDEASVASTRVTPDGYLVAEVRCARTGVQVYDASELGLEGRTGPVRVYRPESVVFAKDSMRTYAGKPVTLGHPPVAVDSSNWKEYAVGDIGEDIARDGEFLRVPIKLMDADAIGAVQRGEQQISMGYDTPLMVLSGVTDSGEHYDAVQTGPIRINHLAVVRAARGGSRLRIGDGADNWGAAPQPTKEGNDMPDQLRSVVVDGLSVQTTDQGAQAIEKLQNQLRDATAAAETQATETAGLRTSVEAKDGEIAALKKQLEDAKSPKAMADAVSARTKVLDAAKTAGVTGTESMTDADVRRAVVAKTLGDAAATEMSDAAVEGAFAALAKTPATQKQPLRIDSAPADATGGGWGSHLKMRKEA